MKILLVMLLLAAPAAGAKDGKTEPAARQPSLPPPKGSHIASDNNMCFQCHTNEGQWDEKDPKSWRRYIPEKNLREDVHSQKGVSCTDCHGGNYDTDKINVAHAKEDGFRATFAEIAKYCAHCHKQEAVDLIKGVHDKAGEKNDRGQGTPLSCEKCHGTLSHHLLPTTNSASPVFLDNQVQTCGGCHKDQLETYQKSVHGLGLYKMGLLVTASCISCHGAHGIYRPADKRSTLSAGKVAATCGKCHRFIEERLRKSVHGRGDGPGGVAEEVAPGGTEKQEPTCTSCHQGHELLNPESAAFRLQLPNLCGNCHADLSKRYQLSLHGQLTELGYVPAAKCSDCHGSHDILPNSDPASPLSAANRAATCGKCHPYTSGTFVSFDPHADYTDAKRNPVLHAVYAAFMTLLISVFGFFGVHSLLWSVRSLVQVFKHGRPRGLVPGETAYVRFVPFHRVAHGFLLVSFLGLALTGLPLKYSHAGWAKEIAYWLGGFGSTSVWHRIFAVVTFGCFATYVVTLLRRYLRRRGEGVSRTRLLFGPDSPLPNSRDLRDFFKMIGWFLGLRRKPTFDRWTYWEKFDFWGACADILIIGSTGLVLWFPNLFCSFLPAVTLNIAKVIHSTQALLATGFVFAIHFFNTHLRAEKFPADMSVLAGLVSEEEMREERGDLYERLRQAGALEQLRTTVPSRRHLWMLRAAGFVALGIGLALLAGMVFVGLGE